MLFRSVRVSWRPARQACVRGTGPARWELTPGGLYPARLCGCCPWVTRQLPIPSAPPFPHQKHTAQTSRLLQSEGALGTCVQRLRTPHRLCGPGQPPRLSGAQGPHLGNKQVPLRGQGCEGNRTARSLSLCSLDASQHLENSPSSASCQHPFSRDRATRGPIVAAIIAAGHIY